MLPVKGGKCLVGGMKANWLIKFFMANSKPGNQNNEAICDLNGYAVVAE